MLNLPKLTLLFALLLVSISSYAEPDASSIVEKSLNAFYYTADDMQVNVKMQLINTQGQIRERDMVMLRKNTDQGGEQKYYIYFQSPSDVKGTSFMVWKYTQQEDDRWIFIPAVKMVRRIAADDKRSSFVGSDFTYEDVSGRDIQDETHSIKALGDSLDGRQVYIIESRPKSDNVDYAKRIAWIDKERWVPLKEQYFDGRGELIREFTADKVEKIDNFWSITARTMKNTQTGHRTKVTWSKVNYNVGLAENLFSERYLRNPPRQWIR